MPRYLNGVPLIEQKLDQILSHCPVIQDFNVIVLKFQYDTRDFVPKGECEALCWLL